MTGVGHGTDTTYMGENYNPIFDIGSYQPEESDKYHLMILPQAIGNALENSSNSQLISDSEYLQICEIRVIRDNPRFRLLIPDPHAISQSLPQFPPTIFGRFRLAYTHPRVAVDAQTDREVPPPRLAQRPVARSAAE